MNQESLFGDRLKAFQADRLRLCLQQAAATPYWKNQFNRYKLNAEADDIFSELNKLPFTTKDVVQDRREEFYPVGLSKNGLVSANTSGTTGGGLVFHITRQAEQIQWATWWRYRMWHGIKFDTWCGYFGGRFIVPLNQYNPPYWRTNPVGRQVMFSNYHLSEKTAVDYWEALQNSPIEWLHGYPSTLALLAGYALEQELPRLPKLRIITIGAESLLTGQFKLIEKAFGVPVRQHYGLAEGVANISECEFERLHVDEDFSFVEFVPIDKQLDVCRIVGTNWNNLAFPLLRYDTGDLAILDPEPCSCSRNSRVVKQIDGRQEDYVVMPNGTLIGRLDHIFKDMVNVREAQVYQPDNKFLIFRIVKRPGFNEQRDESMLIAEARKRLGKEIGIEIDYVEQIQRTKTGKLRFVISDIEANRLT